MRRLLALLLALLIAAPSAADVAVVLPPPEAGVGALATAENNDAVFAVLGRMGVNYDVFRTSPAVPLAGGNMTELCRTGIFPRGALPAKQYDAVIHLNATNNRAHDAWYNPDTLMHFGSWPLVPQLFVFEAYNGNTNIWGSASDSTHFFWGASGPTLPSNNNPPLGTYGQYFIDASLGVRVDSGGYYLHLGSQYAPIGANVNQGNVLTGGSWRAIIGSSCAASSNGAGSWQDLCVNCDSLTAPHAAGNFTIPDTSTLWVRYRNSTPATPQVYAILGPGGSGTPYTPILMAGLAMIDSATGGKVFGDKTRIPLKMSVVVRNAFSRSHYNSQGNGLLEAGGSYCDSLCDTTNVKAGIDSLNTLGIPITVCANTDSVTNFPYELAWWSRLKRVHYTPQNYAGVVSNKATNALKYRLNDTFGHQRNRQLYPVAGCTDADTTIYCLVKDGFARCDSIWPGLTDRAIVPPYADYLPNQWTRATSSGGDDSLLWAMFVAGARAIVIDPDLAANKPGQTFDVTGTLPITNPFGITPAPQNVLIRDPASGKVIGRLALLGSRGWHSTPGQPYFTSHDYVFEYLTGLFTGRWYFDAPGLGTGKMGYYYSHYFDASTQVLQVTAGSLGGTGVAATRPAQRPGWWMTKWIVNWVKTINGLAGREIVSFGYLQDTPAQ